MDMSLEILLWLVALIITVPFIIFMIRDSRQIYQKLAKYNHETPRHSAEVLADSPQSSDHPKKQQHWKKRIAHHH